MADFSAQRPIRVAIVGGGMSGIAQAIRLKRDLGARVKLTVFEKREALGGVWRDSKWPGAGVDVPIHLYSLYSDLNPDWSRLYAEQPEVLAYWESLVDKHGLRSSFAFNSEYVGSEWHDGTQSHTITIRRTTDNSTYTVEADVIISANGPLSTPLIPVIEGFDQFQGKFFHNLHWDSSVQLAGKRIAVLGNGSSGIQLIPGVAALPGVQLTHFIRSGGYFIPKVNIEYSPLIKWVFRWIPFAQRLHRFRLFVQVCRFHRLARYRESNDRWRARAEPQARPTKDEIELLTYLRKTAPPEYLDALTPNYPLGCKRPAFNLQWLETLHRPNVHLTNSPIVRANQDGFITADGKEHHFDVVIFATGSNVAEHGVGVNIGLKGQQKDVDLQQHWKNIGGPQAYLGTAVPKFPNYFQILGPNAIAGSWGFTIGCKTKLNALLVKGMVEHNITSLQPREDAFERHNEEVQRKLTGSSMKSTQCTSWWRVGGRGLVTVPNWVTGFGLAHITSKVYWDDWLATRLVPGEKAALVEVNVPRAIRRRRLLKAGALLPFVTAALYYFLATDALSSNSLARDLVERVREVVARIF